jgi:hypothetical protein
LASSVGPRYTPGPKVPVPLLFWSLALAAAVPPAQFSGGFPVTRRDQIITVDQLKRGDHGIGYTVFAEDVPKPFDVEVLGVMTSMLGPGQDVVLVKLSGKEIEFSGVIAGMSGSPVYFDGKLLGAVAYRFGAFTKEPIAGITPITSMIATEGPSVDPRPIAKNGASGMERGVSTLAIRQREAPPLGRALPMVTAIRGDARPIDTPISVAGLGADELAAFEARLAGTGLVPVAGGSSGKPRRLGIAANEPSIAGAVRAAPIAPASPIAALLMTGDIDIAAIGTVTMVENGKVWAFGHPFLGGGHVELPMATASILNTLASEAGSYKQGLPSLEVGAVIHDRLTTIAGPLGQKAKMIPVSVRLRRAGSKTAPDLLSAKVEIVDSADWLPVMLETAIASVGARRLGYEPGGTVDLVARIKVGDRTLEIKDSYASPPPMRVSAFAARDVANLAAIITGNEIVAAHIDAIDVELTTTAEVDVATVLEVVPDSTRVKAGEKLGLTARLRSYRGGDRTVRLELPIPRDVEGVLSIEVGGGIELDRRDAIVFGERFPRDLDALLGILAERRPAKALYARSYPLRSGVVLDAELYPSLPASAKAALESRESHTQKGLSEAFGPIAGLPLDEVVFGGVSLTIDVVR